MAKVAAGIRLSLQNLLGVVGTLNTSSSESSLVYYIFPLLLVAVTAILTWRIVVNGTTSSGRRPPPPPGKLALPIVGNGDTVKFFAAFSTLRTREYVVQKIKECGSPVFKANIVGQTTVFLDAPEGNKILFSSTDDSLGKNSLPVSFKRLFSHGWVHYRGDEFKALKNYAVDHLFGPDILQRYLPIVERNVMDQMVGLWMGKEDGAVIESHSDFKTLSLGVIAELCLGSTDRKKIDELKPLFEIFSQGMFVPAVNLPGFQFYRSLQADKQIIRILKNHITQRRKKLEQGRARLTQDFLSVLLTCPNQDGYYYKDEEIIGNLKTLLWAGCDSTAITLTLVLRCVAKHQEVYEQLLREHSTIAHSKRENKCLTREDIRSMKYSWRVIQETMRATPVVGAMTREAARDFEYKGFTIKKGWKVWCTAAQSSLNPDLIDNPNVFDPTRFEQPGVRVPRYTFFPFGMGHRQCPGMELGKMVMLVTLHHFVKNFKWTSVNPDARTLYTVLPYLEDGSLIRISRRDYC
ncbi:hypothetical protein R1flu_011791 [Riccia fluitans]|uniref:Cytochrome P450 n=1 Tax=Riccia fluitans TaxID=41844 RepID=A0ABD1Z8S3_9MARC